MAVAPHVYRLLTTVILIIFSYSINAENKLCFDPESRKIQTGSIGYQDNLSINDVHALALQSSSLVYKLADLTTVKTGAELIERHHAFNALTPTHYSVANGYLASRNTGLKMVILEPKQPGWPYIMAITGTETALDWLIDLNLGRAQLEELMELQYIFTYCSYTSSDGLPYSSKNWLITGHSLGGGLAQAFAYSVQKQRLKMGLDPAAIELVTFNGFGAAEVVEKSFEETKFIAETMSIFNYYLTGDVVSKIGRHIGDTFEVNADNVPSGIGNRHALQSFWQALSQTGQVRFDLAEGKMPPYSKALNGLKGVGSYLQYLAENRSERVHLRLHELNVLEEATNIILKRNFSRAYDKDLKAYLIRMTNSFRRALQSEPESSLRIDMLRRIEKVNEVLARAR